MFFFSSILTHAIEIRQFSFYIAWFIATMTFDIFRVRLLEKNYLSVVIEYFVDIMRGSGKNSVSIIPDEILYVSIII